MQQTVQGQVIPSNLIGALIETPASDPVAIRAALDNDGYVFLRNVLDVNDVLAARTEVFAELESVDEIKSPAVDGIATGTSRRAELHRDLGAFWTNVSNGQVLRHVTHGQPLNGILASIFEQPVRGHDLIYLRPTPPDRSTRLHYDFPFFAGKATRIVTAWIPLGDIAADEGPLAIVENSSGFNDLLDPIRNIDYQSDHSNNTVQQAAYDKQNETDPVTMLRDRGSRFLTSEYRVGDLLVFDGFTMHGSLDNQSKIGRVRLSVDVRYQAAAEPTTDERYFGANPKGSKGQGYADMRGALPLDQPW